MFSDSAAVRSLGWIRSTPRRIWDGKTCRTWWTGHASSLRWALSHPSAFETFRDITSMGDRPKIGLKSTDMKAESWQAFQKQLVNALVRHISFSRYVALLRTKSAWIDSQTDVYRYKQLWFRTQKQLLHSFFDLAGWLLTVKNSNGQQPDKAAECSYRTGLQMPAIRELAAIRIREKLYEVFLQKIVPNAPSIQRTLVPTFKRKLNSFLSFNSSGLTSQMLKRLAPANSKASTNQGSTMG